MRVTGRGRSRCWTPAGATSRWSSGYLARARRAQRGGRRPAALMPTSDPADAVFAALSDGTRRGLLAQLGRHGEATATDLARGLPVSRQAVQSTWALLAGAGLVAARRSGREVLYRPTPAPMTDALAWMAEVGGQWDDRLGALEQQLAKPALRRRRTVSTCSATWRWVPGAGGASCASENPSPTSASRRCCGPGRASGPLEGRRRLRGGSGGCPAGPCAGRRAPARVHARGSDRT